MKKSKMEVVVRIKPFSYSNPREVCVCEQSKDEKSVILREVVVDTERVGPNEVLFSSEHNFSFDMIFGQVSTQQDLALKIGKNMADQFLAGVNVSIIAYGQTGSGKTHTIQGVKRSGLMYSFCSEVMKRREKTKVFLSYLQIYNE